MGNEEYKEIMDELYKFLRDKISISLGEYLSDEAKEKLFSFDFENNIVVGKETNKIIEYKLQDDKIYVSDEFLTPQYIEKIKEKNPDYDIVDLKNRINDENPRVLLEELVVFSSDLKITEKDLIKSLFIQEILKMLLMNEEIDAKEDAIMTGTIELLAHNIGSQNGFLVSTPKKYEPELEIAIGLKDELEDKFEEVILKGNVLEYLSRIQNSRLLEKINELADNRKIIESTQNLDNVIDSIVNITKENEEIIENIEKKEENVNTEQINKEEVLEASTPETKEEIIEINDNETVESTIISKPLPETNQINANEVISVSGENNVVETPQNNEVKVEEVKPTKNNKSLIIYIAVIVIVVLLGILIGYLLFKFK